MAKELYKKIIQKELLANSHLQQANMDFEALVEEWGKPEVRREFGGKVTTFLAYKAAESKGQIR